MSKIEKNRDLGLQKKIEANGGYTTKYNKNILKKDGKKVRIVKGL